jgi:hypothetical protein
MRTKRKVENDLPLFTRGELRYAAHFGAKPLGNRALFELAKDFHHAIKLNCKDDPAKTIVALFREAIERKDFTKVATFVDLLAEWTCECEECEKGIPGFGYWIPGGKDPVTKVLMDSSQKLVRLSSKPFDFKRVTFRKLKLTARQIMHLLHKRAPHYDCDIKTLRNRAKELGLTFAPDQRGLRKGQKRNHVHRVQR